MGYAGNRDRQQTTRHPVVGPGDANAQNLHHSPERSSTKQNKTKTNNMIPATNPTRPVQLFTWQTIPGSQTAERGWVPPSKVREKLCEAKCFGFVSVGDSTEMDVLALCELPDGRVDVYAIRDIKFLDVTLS
jgi:hypothetical protein